MKRFEGQVVIVTGAAQGIGRGIAEGFVRDGAIVIGFDVDAAGLQEASRGFEGLGHPFHAMTVDVSDDRQSNEGIAAVGMRYGRIDVLVNNAGINMNRRLAQLESNDWDRVFDTNLKSIYTLAKAAWPYFERQKAGNIVNIASVLGQVGYVGAPAYCAAKSGVIMLTRCLARDGAPLGIRVNSVCPGYIDTPILDRFLADQGDPMDTRRKIIESQPIGRLGLPEDIANGVMFLASREASFISGISLTIDGAFTATQLV